MSMLSSLDALLQLFVFASLSHIELSVFVYFGERKHNAREKREERREKRQRSDLRCRVCSNNPSGPPTQPKYLFEADFQPAPQTWTPVQAYEATPAPQPVFYQDAPTPAPILVQVAVPQQHQQLTPQSMYASYSSTNHLYGQQQQL